MVTPRGFTLLEMVVVLTILALLATVAVRSLDGQLDQSKYDATISGMQNIQDAVIGPANQRLPDGMVSVTGFVADMGRLPQVLPVKQADGVTPVTISTLQSDGTTVARNVNGPVELWSNPNGFFPFEQRRANSSEVAATDQDSDVYVPCGWRGPYLRLGIGQTDPRDGWGNPYDFLLPNRNVCNGTLNDAANLIGILRSNGANGLADNAPAAGYDPDLYVNFNTLVFNGTTAANDYPAVAASDSYHGNVRGDILAVDSTTSPATIDSPLTANGYVCVRYFGPRPDGKGIVAITVPDNGNGVVSAPDPSNGNATIYSKTVNDVTLSVSIDTTTRPLKTVVSYSVSNATIGPRVIRAYQGGTAFPVLSQTVLPTTPPTAKSAPATIVITNGGSQKDLIIR